MFRKAFGFPVINFNAEGGSGGAGDPPAPESVLFPAEGEGEQKITPDPSAGDQGGDWKEYVDDPTKTPEENAAAEAEHDKTKPAEKKDGDDKNDPANQVPADGKYTLTMPDGIELDTELADALGPEFKELGLTNAQANKLVGKYIETMQKRGEAHAASPEGAWSAAAHQYFKDNGTPDKWADTAKADKDIGGDKWDSTVSDARRAVDQLGTPALKDFLNASGGGNHPELIRMFAKAGALLKEDNPPNGDGKGSGKPADAAHLLFPNDAPKG